MPLTIVQRLRLAPLPCAIRFNLNEFTSLKTNPAGNDSRGALDHAVKRHLDSDAIGSLVELFQAIGGS